MKYAQPTRGHRRPQFAFQRNALPEAANYFAAQGLQLRGNGEWKSALCPFHKDSKPSLRVRLDSGAFRCMVCGAKGGDVLAFHMQKHDLSFVDAAKELGAWVSLR